MQLTPLQRSAEYDSIEAQLKALTLRLYQKHLAAKVTELGLSGMPNLASDEFISRELNNDGLAILRDTADENIRYLFHAFRYRNPQRGTAFLRTYLNALFGPVFTVDQLWCPIEGVYPHEAVSEAEVAALGKSLNDHFLTSRLQVNIDTEVLPARIVEAAKTAVGAKFVLDVRLAKTISLKMQVAIGSWGMQVVRAAGKALFHQRPVLALATVGGGMYAVGSGEGVRMVKAAGNQVIRQPVVRSGAKIGYRSQPGAATFVYSTIPRVDMQTYEK